MIAAGTIILKKMLERAGEASEKLFKGEITVTKRDCWLAGAVLLLAGVALGFIHAPLTHGVRINLFSNNGNDNGNNSGNGGSDCCCQDEEAAEEGV